MKQNAGFHVATVGWNHRLVDELCNAIGAKSRIRFSHIVHPRYVMGDWPEHLPQEGIHFFRHDLRQQMPTPDHELLASLEGDGVPTVHNMILGDRVLSKVTYADAVSYATFLTNRLIELLSEIRPTVVIGGFDAVHGGLALAVAKRLNLPWFALHFSVIPPGMACFCDRMTPAARVLLHSPSSDDLRSFAATSLEQFERGRIEVPAYIAPSASFAADKIAKLPRQLLTFVRTIRRSRVSQYLQYTEAPAAYSVSAAAEKFGRASFARRAISRIPTITRAPTSSYVLFGLHRQPESSIDVWASFFSDQMWVIKLFSRSIPATHKLLVKIHKSDVAKYSRKQLEEMRSLPGVAIVAPAADTRQLIENANLVVAIQGTMGLEAALLGKQVVMLGESPNAVFPNVTTIGEISDLPSLLRRRLVEPPPERRKILDAYTTYLAPFMPASHNDWTARRGEDAIDGYVELFGALEEYLRTGGNRQEARLNS